ncbi:unnamed protein product [Ambrosiozyma monospora]|uniref:Unnamed protein product n=1 Tax=Ambrosiozyma monospora TaxID=43982 RepID=A0A9W6YUY1_AMBMO|nr:unnamed protein product [Ambrosiozyma monospora]
MSKQNSHFKHSRKQLKPSTTTTTSNNTKTSTEHQRLDPQQQRVKPDNLNILKKSSIEFSPDKKSKVQLDSTMSKGTAGEPGNVKPRSSSSMRHKRALRKNKERLVQMSKLIPDLNDDDDLDSRHRDNDDESIYNFFEDDLSPVKLSRRTEQTLTALSPSFQSKLPLPVNHNTSPLPQVQTFLAQDHLIKYKSTNSAALTMSPASISLTDLPARQQHIPSARSLGSPVPPKSHMHIDRNDMTQPEINQTQEFPLGDNVPSEFEDSSDELNSQIGIPKKFLPLGPTSAGNGLPFVDSRSQHPLNALDTYSTNFASENDLMSPKVSSPGVGSISSQHADSVISDGEDINASATILKVSNFIQRKKENLLNGENGIVAEKDKEDMVVPQLERKSPNIGELDRPNAPPVPQNKKVSPCSLQKLRANDPGVRCSSPGPTSTAKRVISNDSTSSAKRYHHASSFCQTNETREETTVRVEKLPILKKVSTDKIEPIKEKRSIQNVFTKANGYPYRKSNGAVSNDAVAYNHRETTNFSNNVDSFSHSRVKATSARNATATSSTETQADNREGSRERGSRQLKAPKSTSPVASKHIHSRQSSYDHPPRSRYLAEKERKRRHSVTDECELQSNTAHLKPLDPPKFKKRKTRPISVVSPQIIIAPIKNQKQQQQQSDERQSPRQQMFEPGHNYESEDVSLLMNGVNAFETFANSIEGITSINSADNFKTRVLPRDSKIHKASSFKAQQVTSTHTNAEVFPIFKDTRPYSVPTNNVSKFAKHIDNKKQLYPSIDKEIFKPGDDIRLENGTSSTRDVPTLTSSSDVVDKSISDHVPIPAPKTKQVKDPSFTTRLGRKTAQRIESMTRSSTSFEKSVEPKIRRGTDWGYDQWTKLYNYVISWYISHEEQQLESGEGVGRGGDSKRSDRVASMHMDLNELQQEFGCDLEELEVRVTALKKLIDNKSRLKAKRQVEKLIHD